MHCRRHRCLPSADGTAALTALYVDSVLAGPLASLATRPRLNSADIATLLTCGARPFEGEG